MLQESAERFVSGEAGFAHAHGANAFSPANWKSMAELGWLMLMIPEDKGGLGGATVDAALLTEKLGRGLVISPFISTAVIAAGLLARADPLDDHAALLDAIGAGDAIIAVATEEAASRYDLNRIKMSATRTDGAFTLKGEKIVVQDGAIANHFLVSALHEGKPALFVVAADASGVSLRRYRTIDHAPACDITLTDAPATLLIRDAAAPLERAIDEARVLLAAEALGCMEAALGITAEYLKTRKQFGRTLSSFQTLTHRVADGYVQCEQLRSILPSAVIGNR